MWEYICIYAGEGRFPHKNIFVKILLFRLVSIKIGITLVIYTIPWEIIASFRFRFSVDSGLGYCRSSWPVFSPAKEQVRIITTEQCTFATDSLLPLDQHCTKSHPKIADANTLLRRTACQKNNCKTGHESVSGRIEYFIFRLNVETSHQKYFSPRCSGGTCHSQKIS